MRRLTRARKVLYKDSSSSDESDEEISDYEETTVTKRKRVRNTTTTKTKKAKKPKSNHKELELPDNFIFESMSQPNVDVSDIVLEWIEAFELDQESDEPQNSNESITLLINFVLRCCGSLQMFQPHDLLNLESASDTVGELSIAFSQQESHKYPFKTLAPFKNNVLQFFAQLIEIGHERGVLYNYDEAEKDSLTSPLMLQLITWIGTLSSCSIRPLRYTSTLILLTMLSQLCKVMKINVSSLEKAQRQLAKTSKKSLAKYANVSQTVQNYHKQKDTITEYFDEITNITLGHRYRDIDPLIRQECIKYLSQAMIVYPDYFLDAKFLRYFGWLLSDPNNSVRVEVTRVLLKLYRSVSGTMTAGLGQFSERYKQQMIKMARIDLDFPVRLNLTSICCELAKFGFFDNENNVEILGNFYRMISRNDTKVSAANSIKIKTEFAKFIGILNLKLVTEEQEKLSIFIDNYTSKEIGDDSESQLSLKNIFKYKCLIGLLQVSLDDYISKPGNDGEARDSIISTVFQNLYQSPTYDHDWEFLVKFLLFDFSSIEFTSETANLDEDNVEIEKFKQFLELKEVEKVYLLNFIYGSFILMYDNLSSKAKDLMSSSILVKLVNHLPSLATLLMKSNALLNSFLQFWTLLISSSEVSTNIYTIFDNLNQVSQYNTINKNLIKYFQDYDLATLETTELLKSYQKYLGKLLESYSTNTPNAINLVTSDLRLEIQDITQNLSLELSSQLKAISNDDIDDDVNTQKLIIEKLIEILPIVHKLQILGEQIDINEFMTESNSSSVPELIIFKIFNRLDFDIIINHWANNFLKIGSQFSESLCKILDLILVCASWKLENLVSYEETNQKFYDVEAILDDDMTIINQLIRLLESLDGLTKQVIATFGSSLCVVASTTNCVALISQLNDFKTLLAAKIIDMTTSIKIFYVKFNKSNGFKNFDEFFSDEHFGKFVKRLLPKKLQLQLLDIYLYKETKLAKALNIELERADNENVNFDDIVDYGNEDIDMTNESRFDSDDEDNDKIAVQKDSSISNQIKIWDLEKSLCVFTLKLISVIETSMVSEFIWDRLQLNSEKIGGVYNTIIKKQVEALEKYQSSKGDTNVITPLTLADTNNEPNPESDVREINEIENDNEQEIQHQEPNEAEDIEME